MRELAVDEIEVVSGGNPAVAVCVIRAVGGITADSLGRMSDGQSMFGASSVFSGMLGCATGVYGHLAKAGAVTAATVAAIFEVAQAIPASATPEGGEKHEKNGGTARHKD